MSVSVVLFFLFVFLSLHCVCVKGYASYMTTSQCSRSLNVGTVIMTNQVVSSNKRSVWVMRDDKDGTDVSNGSRYKFGERFMAHLSSDSGEYVIEVLGGAAVDGGGCSKTRIANDAASFAAPSGGNATITIRAAWTESDSDPVAVTATTFTLLPPEDSSGGTDDDKGDSSSSSKEGLSTGAKAGIGVAVGVVALAVLITVAMVLGGYVSLSPSAKDPVATTASPSPSTAVYEAVAVEAEPVSVKDTAVVSQVEVTVL